VSRSEIEENVKKSLGEGKAEAETAKSQSKSAS
jgi:hypothetical protein